MSLFHRSQGNRVAKAITKEFVEPAFGDNVTWSDRPLKNIKPMQKHHMLKCKHSMMIYLGSSIAHRPMIYENV